MTSCVLEQEQLSLDIQTGRGRPANVIVLNDNHNTFQGVAVSLARIIPHTSVTEGFKLAEQIHHQGQAIVWSGELEVAELYAEQLQSLGLTMAPVERS